MAARFWVTGGVDTNWSTIGNWSLTSGGAGGQTVPSASDDVTFDGNGNSNCVVNTTARVCKTLTFTTGYTSTFQQDQQLTVSGSITLTASSFTWTGTSTNKLRMNAAGTITTAGRVIPHDVEIGVTTTFTCTLADNFSCGSNLLTLTNTTSTIFSGAFTITCGALTISGSQTVTMSGNINPSGLVTISDANLLAGTFTITCAAGITMTGTLGISANSPALSLTGGTWSGAAVCSVPITFAGNVTVSGGVAFSGTLTYSSGTITTTGSTLNLGAATTLNTAGITWANITTTGTSITYTLTSNLVWSGTLTLSNTTAMTWTGAFTMTGGDITHTTAATTNFNVTSPVVCGVWTGPDTALTLAGSAGMTCATFTNTLITAARTYTLTQGNTYIVTSNFAPITPSAAAGTIRYLTITSSHAANQVILTLQGGATQIVGFVSATRIDSSQGQTIYDPWGTLTTTTNWSATLPVNMLPPQARIVQVNSSY